MVGEYVTYAKQEQQISKAFREDASSEPIEMEENKMSLTENHKVKMADIQESEKGKVVNHGATSLYRTPRSYQGYSAIMLDRLRALPGVRHLPLPSRRTRLRDMTSDRDVEKLEKEQPLLS